MTAISFADLKTVATVLERVSSPEAVSVPKAARVDAPVGAEQRFSQAMDKAASDKVLVPAAVQPTAPPTTVNAAQSSAAAEANPDAQERARHALKLDAPTSNQKKHAAGDAVLDGLQKLRGVFGKQEGRLSHAMSLPLTDVNTMYALQVEMIKFTTLVDVTAKLTGQSTQALSALLKG